MVDGPSKQMRSVTDINAASSFQFFNTVAWMTGKAFGL